MLLYIYRYVLGFLKIELLGVSPERFLNMCVHHHIHIWNLQQENNCYTFNISRLEFRKLCPIARKTKCKCKIIEKYGLPFLLYHYRNRKIFAIGLCFFIFTIFYMSKFLWGIELSGNSTYTTEDIITYLNGQGIQRTVQVNTIDCDEVVSLLRKEYDNIIWASAHIEGAKIIIEVKENQNIISSTSEIDYSEDRTEIGYDIISDYDGMVTSIITRKGTPLVNVGDIVSVGDILVSGRIDITDDYEEIVSYNYVTADATITIQTIFNYCDSLSINYDEKKYISYQDTSYFLSLNQYYISIDDIITPIFQDVDTENYLWDIQSKTIDISPIQQNFLMLNIGYISSNAYEWIEKNYTGEEIQYILSDSFNAYCDDLEEKKVEIIEKNVKIHIGETLAQAIGDVTVEVDTTTLQRTEVLDMPILLTEEGNTE